ncbi:MAG: FAD:protein FMN transferase [Eubacteriales bacterium]
MKKISVALALFLVLGLSSCQARYTKYTKDFFGAFDTSITVSAYTTSERDFEDFFDKVQSRFLELHRLYDIYNSYDGIVNVKTINDSAGVSPVKVGEEILDLLEFSIKYNSLTDGKFNIAFGSVLKIWHDYREAASPERTDNAVPTQEELREADKYTSIDSLVLDKAAGTAYISDPNASLDVGSVAKGYAVELVCDEMTAQGYTSFAISAGGNVKAVGQPISKERDRWYISIQKPRTFVSPDPGEDILCTLAIKDLCVVTSGGYQRYFVSGDRTYHHLIDPDTLFPSEYYKSVSIIAEDSGLCDILSTAVFMMPYEQALAFFDGLDGVEAVFVLPDDTVEYSTGMNALLKK